MCESLSCIRSVHTSLYTMPLVLPICLGSKMTCSMQIEIVHIRVESQQLTIVPRIVATLARNHPQGDD
jgi:hypothetical protein